MNFRPLGDNILIENLEDSQAGGLIISEENKRILTGKVVAVGNGRLESFGLIKSKLNIGDTVWYPSFSEQKIRLDGKTYSVVPEKEILGFNRDENPSVS